MRPAAAAGLAVLLLFHGMAGYPLETAAPQDVGMLPERLDRIGRVVTAAIDNGEIPGAVALIARNGKIAYRQAFGYADIESKAPMQIDAIFRIASMTKAVTSVAAMILYEDGRFQLNDPISRYLPEFAELRVVSGVNDDGRILETAAANAPIRIIDLLSHTSGISYPFIPSKVQASYVAAGIINGLTAEDRRLASQMQLLSRQPLLFEPGTAFAYGLNTDLLGYLIEVVSGQSLARFIEENITAPLSMRDTHFYLPDAQAQRLATLYSQMDGRGLVVSQGNEGDLHLDNPNYPIAGAKTYFSGGAGLSSTAYDYARFLQMLLNGGELDGVRILSRKSVELMTAPRVDRDNDQRADTALGFAVIGDLGSYGELGSVGAYSWGGAFYTTYWIDPAEKLVAVFMSQVRPANTDVAAKFKTLVYQALE